MNIVPYHESEPGRHLMVPGSQIGIFTGQELEPAPILIRYWSVINRRKWVVISVIVGALLLGAIFTVLATPQYVASATLEISRETENITGVESVSEQATTVDQEFYATQYGLLRSRMLARSVAEDLNLAENKQFREIFKLDDRVGLFSSWDEKKVSPTERVERLDEAEATLLKHVTVAPAPDSRLVELRFTSPDPNFSARVANSWVEHFMRSSLERRFGSASYARDFLETRLEQVRQRLEGAERKLVDYATAQGIVSINSGATGGEIGGRDQSLASNNLSLLNAELAEATGDRMRAQSRLSRASERGNSTESLANQAITALRQRRAEAAAEYARLMVEFEPGYPRARAFQSQIDELDQAIAREEQRVSGSLQGEYRSELARETALRSRVNQHRADVLDLRRRSIQYNIYQRDVDTSRSLYEGLLQRYKEIGIAGGVGRSNVAVVDPAKAPKIPSSPKPVLNLLLALIVGNIAGFAIAFGLEQIDEVISDPHDLPKRLGLPLLGVIIRAKDEQPLEALADRSSGIAEGYVSVSTNLQFSTPSGVPKTMVITSARPSEGKTTSALALAMVLARSGHRVLLVDGDMRSPSVHKILQLKNESGLSNLLSGNALLEELVQPTMAEGVSALTAGPSPPNAAELLSGAHLEQFYAKAAEKYDHVIIDSPPVLGLADAPLLSSRAEAVIFVVQARSTKIRVIERSLARLSATHSRVLGGVLTKFDPKFAESGYGYGYGEEYQYGYGRLPSKAA